MQFLKELLQGRRSIESRRQAARSGSNSSPLDYQNIPQPFQNALVQCMNPGEELYWWSQPPFWRTYGPVNRLGRSFFGASIFSTLFIWLGTLHWLYIIIYYDPNGLYVTQSLIEGVEYFGLALTMSIFYGFVFVALLVIGYGFGSADGFGRALYAITDSRLIRIYQKFFLSPSSGFAVSAISFHEIKDYENFKFGPQPASRYQKDIDTSQGKLRLEVHRHGCRLLYQPVYVYPISLQTLSSKSGTSLYPTSPSEAASNQLLALNGFLYVADVRELIPILQRTSNNGQLTSAFATGVSFVNNVASGTELPLTNRGSDQSSSSSSSNEAASASESSSSSDTKTSPTEGFSIQNIPVPMTRLQELVQGLGVILVSFGACTLITIAIAGSALKKAKIAFNDDDLASVSLIPIVFTTWFIMLVVLTLINYWAIGPIIDIFHIDLKNLDQDNEGLLEDIDDLNEEENFDKKPQETDI